MGRYRKSLWENAVFGFGVSVLYGMTWGLGSSMLFSALSFFVFKAILFGRLFTVLTLGISGYAAGWLCGRYRRHRGMIDGALCGGLIYAVLFGISLIFGELTDIWKLMLLAAMGAVGGVVGVNTLRPKNLM